MTLKLHNPDTVAQPLFPVYSNGVEVPPNARWYYSAGMVGMGKDGKVPEGIAAQAEIIWQSLTDLLKAADMDVTDIVKMVAYVVHGQDMKLYGPVRGKYLKGHRPASTMITVPALVTPEFLIEVEIVAAKA